MLSQSLDRPLTYSDRLKLKFHLLICAACKRFNIQIKQLSVAVKMLTRQTESDDAIQLTSDAKARISEKIANASTSNQH